MKIQKAKSEGNLKEDEQSCRTSTSRYQDIIKLW